MTLSELGQYVVVLTQVRQTCGETVEQHHVERALYK
jgi:hypothetical protein